MVKKVTMWEATDGSLHATEGLADEASNFADLQDYVDQNPIICFDHSVSGSDLVSWLKKQDRIYIQLLPEHPQNPTPRVNIPDPDDTVIYCSHEWKSAETDPSEPSYMICRKCGVNGDDLYLGNKNGN